MLNLFHMVGIQRREPNVGDFMKQTFNSGLLSDADELISFKLGMTIDTAKLCGLRPVWIAFILAQGDRVCAVLLL